MPDRNPTGVIKLFPAREILVSDTSAGDGKNDKLFYSVKMHFCGTAS